VADISTAGAIGVSVMASSSVNVVFVGGAFPIFPATTVTGIGVETTGVGVTEVVVTGATWTGVITTGAVFPLPFVSKKSRNWSPDVGTAGAVFVCTGAAATTFAGTGVTTAGAEVAADGTGATEVAGGTACALVCTAVLNGDFRYHRLRLFLVTKIGSLLGIFFSLRFVEAYGTSVLPIFVDETNTIIF
jgi:hypothetical protein